MRSVDFVLHVTRIVDRLEVEGTKHVNGFICRVKASRNICDRGNKVFG